MTKTPEDARDPSQHESVHLDHHSADYAENHQRIMAELRGKCPVVHSSALGGFYVATKYGEVAQAARDDATFSSAHLPDNSRQGIGIPGSGARLIGFLEMDPPESMKYRKALMPMFSKEAVEQREPAMRRIVEEAVDSFIERGSCDIVEEFTDRVPALATINMLGLPTEIWKPFAHYLHEFVGDPLEVTKGRTKHEDPWFIEFLAKEIADRQRNPRQDGLTWVVEREVDGKRVPDPILLENVFLLMIGGFDPVSSFMSNVFLYLSENPDQRERLRNEPELMDSACEELLRYITPVLSLGRTVTRSCTLGGQQLKEGDRLLLSWVSANHDEAEFPDADKVILDRFPNRHQAFGLGSHRCLGSHVARTLFRLMVSEVLERMPDYVIDKAASVPFPSRAANNGWFSMPMTFTPGPLRHAEQKVAAE